MDVYEVVLLEKRFLGNGIVLVEQCRLPAVVPVKSLGTGGNIQ